MNNGLLITCEGIDGAGKSTICKLLAAHLTAQSIPVLLTKEPGSTPLGLELRNMVQHRHDNIAPIAEFLLFAADRAQHFNTVVEPALADCKIVISDRMGDSSLAYQGYGRGLSIEMISSINRWAMGNSTPDITLYLTIDPQLAHERITSRNQDKTRFEKEDAEFWDRVTHGFETIFSTRSNVIYLDATMSPQELLDEIIYHPIFTEAMAQNR